MMKSKFVSLILFFMLLFLISIIIVFGVYIYKDFFGASSESSIYKIDKIYTEEPDPEKKIESTADSIGNLISENNTKEKTTETGMLDNNKKNYTSFFYSQLNDNQRIIYDGLMQNKQYLKQGDFIIKYNDVFTETLSRENGSDVLGDDYQSAIEAFTHDNMDVFYLDVNKMYLNIETSTKFFKTTYNVYISAAKDSNYLSNEFQSIEKIEQAVMQVENEKNRILSNLKGTDYQNILYLHDYLINTVEYDSLYQQLGSYTVYGALIGKKSVCEGYAKAFKYLANCAGYECELLQGTATNNSGQTENHAWNCIKLNNLWYEIDVTWDDPIIIGGNGRTSNDIKYKYFLKGSKTLNQDHTLEYQFSEKGRIWSYPNISSNDY